MRHAVSLAAVLLASHVLAEPMRLGRDRWIVVGTGSAPGAGLSPVAARVREAARRCGVPVFDDLSTKFAGFVPGYEVFVAGSYPTAERAQARLPAIRRCIPDAYVERGRYAGE